MLFSVTASCVNTDDGGGELETAILDSSVESLEYDADNPENNCFTVSSNVTWKADSDLGSLKFSPKTGGEGETVVSVLDIPEGETGTITIMTDKRSTSDKQATVTVTVTRKAVELPEEAIVYLEDLEGGKWNGEKPPFLDQWSGYINASGSGAGNVTYSGRTVSIRDNFPSSSYEGASGGNAFYFGGDGAYVSISGIILPSEYDTYELSFGATQYGTDFVPGKSIRIYLDFNGGDSRSHELNYSRKSSGSWAEAGTVFAFANDVPETVCITFVSNGNNIRIDDIRLEISGKTPENIIDLNEAPKVYPWPEVPETMKQNANYKYVIHRAETIISKKEVRNYSACYDIYRHNPVWVAYPCHECYLEGQGRTEPDPWRPDPLFDESEQSIIYSSDWNDWPWLGNGGKPQDKFQYWSYVNGMSFTRGHLLRSHDRRGTKDKNPPDELNLQTFYPTNIAPEKFQYPNVHSELEEFLTGKWTCSDTCYVVSGCYYENDDMYTYDACSGTTHSSKTKKCIVPTHQFKIYLRTKKGNTGKHIMECDASELMAIGFWLPQNLNNVGEMEGNIRDFARSVDEIEKLTGGEFDFFPGVPDSVTESYTLDDWGL